MKAGNGIVVRVRDLVKQYSGIRAVDGVSFDVYQGEILGMVGPNGAGKTTTIECLEGLRRPDGFTMGIGRQPKAAPAAGEPDDGPQLTTGHEGSKMRPLRAASEGMERRSALCAVGL